MNSLKLILGSFVGAMLILIAFQNCGQSGSLALNSQGTESLKVSADPGLIVEPIDQPAIPAPVLNLPPVAPLQCDTVGLSDISLNILEVKAPSASGASSHLFEIIKNDSAVGEVHTILVRALHSARKIDKIDLILSKDGSLMQAEDQLTLLSVSTAIQGHKIRLFLDRQDYTVTKGQLYTLNFRVDALRQVVKNSCDENDDIQNCVSKKNVCRLFLNLSEGSLNQVTQ